MGEIFMLVKIKLSLTFQYKYVLSRIKDIYWHTLLIKSPMFFAIDTIHNEDYPTHRSGKI